MPSSRGGGSFGGGGGHSFGGGSSGKHGNGRGGQRFRFKPFAGARRYFYFDAMGARHFFYYSGVPVRRSIGTIIASSLFFIIFGILMFSFSIYTIIPRKLSASKCEFYSEYVYDASNLFSESEEEYLKNSLEKFYKETGIQPYVYAVSYDNIPEKYKPVSERKLTDYSYNLYIDTFNDEGHTLILYAFDTHSSDSSGIWVEMVGYDAQDVFTDSRFEIFKEDLNKKLIENDGKAIAIADAFEENIDTVMKLTKSDKMLLACLAIFFALFIIVPTFGFVQSIKQAKEINEYCAYRDSQGGKDFFENDNVPKNDSVTDDSEGSDLFD